MNFLPGWFPGGAMAAKPAAALTFIGNTTDNTATANVSYAGVSIGAADATRRVFVAVHWTVTNAARTISSATIGGISATVHASATTGPTAAQIDTGVAIISALVPTGTTATIAITFSAAITRTLIGVWSSTNEVNSSPTATMTDNTTSAGVLSGTINIPNTGMLVVASTLLCSAAANTTWTGATENYDSTHPSATTQRGTGASGTGMSVETNRAVQSATDMTVTRGALAAVSWG